MSAEQLESLEQQHPLATVHAEEAGINIALGLDAVGDDAGAKEAVIQKINAELAAAGMEEVSLILTPDEENHQRIGKRSGLSREMIVSPHRMPAQKRAQLLAMIRHSFTKDV